MSLRTQAEADLGLTLEDASAFGWPITLTDPSGNAAILTGRYDDVAEQIDPETGQIVAGRRASVTLRRSSIAKAGLAQPTGISSKTSKPWRVTVKDVAGETHEYKVTEPRPDRSIGLVVLILETYEP